MPNVHPPIGDNGPIPGPWWSLIQLANSNGKVAGGVALNNTRSTTDAYGNQTAIVGQLDQVVTVGAGWIASVFQPGVQVGTNLTGQGVATPSGLAHTTISTTSGSTTATVASGTGFVNGYVIGAVAADGSNVIAPGTTYTISGTTVTLSQGALQTATSVYCCSVVWTRTGEAVNP